MMEVTVRNLRIVVKMMTMKTYTVRQLSSAEQRIARKYNDTSVLLPT